VIIVLVRVVVRDAQGKAVTNLKKEDFQLADDRKPQTISSFSVENRGSHGTEVVIPQRESQAATTGTKTVKLPERFVSFFFDDLHLVTQDVMVTRQAATKLFAVLQPTDRISIFTTSGQVEQDFTATGKNLRKSCSMSVHAVCPLTPRPIVRPSRSTKRTKSWRRATL
jgi:VWFA-related protein